MNQNQIMPKLPPWGREPVKPLELGLYKESSGYQSRNVYEVIAIAVDTETMKEVVIYRTVYPEIKQVDRQWLWSMPESRFRAGYVPTPNDDLRRVSCSACGWSGPAAHAPTVVNKSVKSGKSTLCPACQGVYTLRLICEQDGCCKPSVLRSEQLGGGSKLLCAEHAAEELSVSEDQCAIHIPKDASDEDVDALARALSERSADT